MTGMNESTGESKRLRFVGQLLADEQGGALVYFVGVIMLIFAMAGIALDTSNAYAQRRQMQIAADAAALAGARALALEQGASQVSFDVNDMATANGATGANWTLHNSDHNVEVVAHRQVDTFFTKLFGIDSITVNAVAEAGYVPVTTPPELFPPTVSCDCFEHGVKNLVPPENKYCVGNAIQSQLGVHYGIWLRNLDPTYPSTGNQPQWHYEIQTDTGVMMEHRDGTAKITAIVKNQDHEGFSIDFILTGRTLNAPPSSPKVPGFAYDASDWYYYTGLTGELHGLPGGRYDGARLTVTGYGPSFQIGVGANMWDPFEYGGAAWYDITVATQPTTGIYLKTPEKGDINIRLADCSDDLASGDENADGSCNFAWLDWDGGNSSQEELLDYIADPSLSGLWSIGDTVAAGVNPFSTLSDGLSGGLSLSVNATIDEWLGKEVTIALYDSELSTEDQYLICGFGQMVITDYNLDTDPKWFDVTFKPTVIRSAAIDEDAADFGVRDIKLYQ
ncbi:MAG: pilus assembly protein TadG-related protein [Caldilineaceae bacterium]